MKIEILIASYGHASFLRQCVDSILSQTYRDFFITFLDDCSPDETQKIIEGYHDDRIHYFKNEVNMGRGLSRKKLLEIASSEFCCWADTDDYLLPTKIEKQVDFLNSNKTCHFVATEMFDLFRNGDMRLGCNRAEMINDLTLEKLRMSNCINHPTTMFNLNVARQIGFNNMKKNEDWDFYIRLYEVGHRVSAINEPLYVYRIR